MQKLGYLFSLLVISTLFLAIVSSVEIYGSAEANVGLEGSGEANSDVENDEDNSGSSNTNVNLGLGLVLDSDVSVDSGIDVSVSGGLTKITLSNGDEVTLKVTSDEAKQTAEASLEVENCSECNVELTEVKVNNKARAAYNVEAEKRAKFLGIFNTNMNVAANVDVETGQVISIEKPWWAFLAVESKTSVDSNTNVGAGY